MDRPIVFLPPAVALLASALWLGSQHRSISGFQSRNEALAARIFAQREAGAAGEGAEFPARDRQPSRAAPPEAGIRWDDVARHSLEAEAGLPIGLRATMELDAALDAMSEGELIAGLEEIANLEGSPHEILPMLAKGIAALVRTNPGLALERWEIWLDQAQLEDLPWQAHYALGSFAREDPAAAAAWLDRQIAAGRLEARSLAGVNVLHQRLEAGLLQELLAREPAIFSRRLESMDPALRQGALENLPDPELRLQMLEALEGDD